VPTTSPVPGPSTPTVVPPTMTPSVPPGPPAPSTSAAPPLGALGLPLTQSVVTRLSLAAVALIVAGVVGLVLSRRRRRQ
jgi:NADH:ubiquinone oxidoreductase subunit 6 (subunit J)